ncbi:sua5/YciO/YrdC/YwlC family protein [Candidatus Endolissoclinum faulkneri L5]|uniref:Threonylcarbamoyl-AMP synthase n=1 Tax=Candidatus Endolissoclinum faulkneri L5 TaxID=1401328 RepID=V9TWZ8_9PROT|nr:L-threonylcarbamoyladenylate synthase [Candidatus Endolissoclinum faulkneri]AHC73850.1 sua5/YciO/YrdC/YwlC family protein [Candidatus Endolissoclinum faulkneri L5]
MNARVYSIKDPIARAEAGRVILSGGLVAFATETVYGLGGDATNETAVAKIFAYKARPLYNPLISHVHDVRSAFAIGQATSAALAMADVFWPGPLTLVMKLMDGFPLACLTSANMSTVAIRIPGDPTTRALLSEIGRPVAAPSANRSGRLSPTTADHVVAEDFDGLKIILDGGCCAIGVESTVLDVSGAIPRLLRPGAITQEQIEAVVGPIELTNNNVGLLSPGMLASHYAPIASLRLNATELWDGEVGLDFAGQLGLAVDLSALGDLLEAASNLFAYLHALDSPGIKTIAVAPIPRTGVGIAINDRLQRAAA